MITYIGRVIIEYLEWAKGVVQLFLDILYWFIFGPFKGKLSRRQNIFQQMVFDGVDVADFSAADQR